MLLVERGSGGKGYRVRDWTFQWTMGSKQVCCPVQRDGARRGGVVRGGGGSGSGSGGGGGGGGGGSGSGSGTVVVCPKRWRESGKEGSRERQRTRSVAPLPHYDITCVLALVATELDSHPLPLLLLAALSPPAMSRLGIACLHHPSQPSIAPPTIAVADPSSETLPNWTLHKALLTIHALMDTIPRCSIVTTAFGLKLRHCPSLTLLHKREQVTKYPR
ncbi:hypothetical protein B0O80DRAFT_9521 [Mortierella sp. GBAus27b]|nr:hypothetical protein B0O80DRAFT_9521 [Mortierella sp. GBAus27b]